MTEIISTAKWLNIIAAQLEQDGYPKGFSQRLQNVAIVFDTHEAQVAELEAEATRYGFELSKVEEHANRLFLSLRETWQRYEAAVRVLEQYDPIVAEEFARFKPPFYESL
jgi:hypothetical protein